MIQLDVKNVELLKKTETETHSLKKILNRNI